MNQTDVMISVGSLASGCNNPSYMVDGYPAGGGITKSNFISKLKANTNLANSNAISSLSFPPFSLTPASLPINIAI